MGTWINNTGQSHNQDWFARGVTKLGESGGLAFAAFLNLDTGAEVVLYPTTGWKAAEDRGKGTHEYRAWFLPPAIGSAVRLAVRSNDGNALDGYFGGTNSHHDWVTVSNAMQRALEDTLSIPQPYRD